MPKRVASVRRGRPLLDIVSYARPGPSARRLTHAQVEQLRRTVRRVPEVMIKVLSKGGHDLGAVQRHLSYIARHGELDLQTDDGERLQGKDVGKDLLQDWDLDLEASRRQSELAAAMGRKPPKLVHKLMLSMPAGTPPDDLLAAVGTFARQEFGGKHRYAMALHTDEPHPHVHMVVKAVSEQGVRLNIRKETLRTWRQEFARHLRAQGVEANATERSVRGEGKTGKPDGIYRAMLRGESTHIRSRLASLVNELKNGGALSEAGRSKVIATRKQVEQGWLAAGDLLERQREHSLAAAVRRFVNQFHPPATEKEWLASQLQGHLKAPGATISPLTR